MFNRMFLEENKVVPAFVPIDTTGAARSGDWVSLKNYDRLVIVIMQGAWAGGTPAVTLNQASDVAGTGSKALAFTEKWEGTALTADTLTRSAVSSNTFNLTAAANKFTVIEVKASDLDTNNGFDCVQVAVASPGANADLISGLYILGNCRHPSQVTGTPSAIID